MEKKLTIWLSNKYKWAVHDFKIPQKKGPQNLFSFSARSLIFTLVGWFLKETLAFSNMLLSYIMLTHMLIPSYTLASSTSVHQKNLHFNILMHNEFNSDCTRFFLQKSLQWQHQCSILPFLIGIYIRTHQITFPSITNEHLTRICTLKVQLGVKQTVSVQGLTPLHERQLWFNPAGS